MIFQAINWDVDPVIFNLGPLSIRYYGLMFVIAFLLGIYLEKKLYKNDKVSEELVDSLFVFVAIATILGARLGEVFFYSWDDFKGEPWKILFPVEFKPFRIIGFQGLASHGAAIGIIISIIWFKFKKLPQKSVMWILDRVVIPVAIGGSFVRLGNLFNSEIVGKYSGTDFGFIFKRLGETAPRYPTQIYEALGYALVFVVLWFVYWKTDKRKKEGYIFGVFMVLLWAVRFLVEFLKEPQGEESITWGLLNTGQVLSIPLILVGFYFMFRKK
jgi:prolipoprotein diacylglyceryl transferase